MSQGKEKDLLPLLVMLESLGKIEIYANGFATADVFFYDNDQLKFNASLLLLLNIGEQSNKISTELRDKYKDFPFHGIRGLRNRIAHNYTGIDFEMVFDIIKNDLPDIKSKLIDLLFLEVKANSFDPGELNAAQNSIFYKHVDFEKIIP